MNKCYIICGGPEGFGDVIIEEDAYIICADSGYDKALSCGITPDLLIGDFDSIKSIPDGVEIIKAPIRKDDTDTMLAIKTAISKGYEDITLVSAFSGRMDHSLANLSALCYMSEQGITGRIFGDTCNGYFLNEESMTFMPDKSRHLSVFPCTDTAIVSIVGAEYEVHSIEMKKSFPIGVSNEFTDLPCIITAHKGSVFVLMVRK